MPIDFGLTATDYAQHRAGFPDSFFERSAERGLGLPTQTVVDLGTGTGTLARGFARRGCQVTGIDPAEPLIEQARRLSAQEQLTLTFRVGTAEDTGLPEASADLVTAGQCWHWFRGEEAAREVWRILKPNGAVVIAHFDWIPLRGNPLELTESLILQYNPAWAMSGGSGLYPRWLRDLGEAGFSALETFSYDIQVMYSHADWRGRIRASAGIGASLAPAQVEAFDQAFAIALRERFPADPLPVPHRVWAVIGRRR